MQWLLISLYFRHPGAEGSFTKKGAESLSISAWSSGCCHWPVVFSASHVTTLGFADEEVGDEEVGKIGSKSTGGHGTDFELGSRPKQTWI